MADQDCDYCHKSNKCKFAYEQTDCRVTEIQEAKQISTQKFKEFILSLKEQNEVVCSEKLQNLIDIGNEIINDSKEEIQIG